MVDSVDFANDEYEHMFGMTHEEEMEQIRKQTAKWEQVKAALLADEGEFKGRLNDRLCDEYEWASDLEDMLAPNVHVMDLYKNKMLGAAFVRRVEIEASTLASVIVG